MTNEKQKERTIRKQKKKRSKKNKKKRKSTQCRTAIKPFKGFFYFGEFLFSEAPRLS